MKIIPASYEIMDELNYDNILEKLEKCGRVCYKSEDKITQGSSEKFIRGILKRGHEAVIEHFSFSVRFIVDRGISHEIVRHRLASFCQESTRYVNYGNDKNELTFIKPYGMDDSKEIWKYAMQECEDCYLDLIASGASPQWARSVLPNSTKTELIMTANLREWRHFLKLRTSPAAHPQIREVASPLLNELKEKLPVLFEDIDV